MRDKPRPVTQGDELILTAERHAPKQRRFLARDFVGAVLAAALVATAFWVPYRGNKTITPIIGLPKNQVKDFADAAPLFGFRDLHYGWGTPVAILIAVAVVLWGPSLAQRLSWRPLLAATWALSLAWTMSLAMIDGWRDGFVNKLTGDDEYLSQVGRFSDIPATLRIFTTRILGFQADSWTTHTSGHPPGAVLTFVWLDRLGLTGGAWAATLCVLVGTSAALAVIVTIRALGDEAMARRAAPFLAMAPAAIWIAVSADAIFAGVAAWGIALLALAAARKVPYAVSIAGGVLLGFAVYQNYGLGLMALPAVVVLVIAKNGWPLIGALVGALAVAGIFTAYGFWWFDGYQLVQQRYYQGIAINRPFRYWGWANFASLTCAVGLAVPAAFPRLLKWSKLKSLSPVNYLVLASLLIVLAADLSKLSKAETERIWLPFEIWMISAAALLPCRSHRFWLAVQAICAIAINTFLRTNW